MNARPRSLGASRVAGSLAILLALGGLAAFATQLGHPAGARTALAGEAGGADAPEPLVVAPWTDAPRRLSETGLTLADGSVDPRNRPFAPQYPLWTDGAAKSRWIRLPEGAAIGVADVDAWRFPPGTVVWKEFAWGGRKVETRMIRRNPGGDWSFASYAWNEDQTDAILAPESGIPGVFEVAPGRRHSIPGAADCLACHGSAPAVILGFSALQLSDDRDPLAPHAEPLPRGAITLRALVEEGRLFPPRPDLASRPPRIREADPVGRAALGYLSGNCGSCHNPRGPLARLGFSFLHEVAGGPGAPEPARALAVGARSRFAVPGVPPESSLVLAAGDPSRSAALHRMRSRRPSSQMPPLGSVVADTTAIQLVRRWIEGLGARAESTALAGAARPRS